MIVFNRRIAVFAIAATLLSACNQADGQNTTPGTPSGPAVSDIVIGDVNAPITLVEYASWTCPACLQFHNDVMPMLKADYIETGKVKMIFREFPTAPVNLSVAGFSIARCTGTESYYDVIDDLFANQSRILNLARSGGDVEGAVRDIAATYGQTGEKFDACLDNQEIRSAIIDSVERGESQSVTGTPTLFLNDRRVTGFEWRNADGMRAILEAELTGADN